MTFPTIEGPLLSRSGDVFKDQEYNLFYTFKKRSKQPLRSTYHHNWHSLPNILKPTPTPTPTYTPSTKPPPHPNKLKKELTPLTFNDFQLFSHHGQTCTPPKIPSQLSTWLSLLHPFKRAHSRFYTFSISPTSSI